MNLSISSLNQFFNKEERVNWWNAFYSFSFQILGQFLRLSSNIILTYFLIPELFGVMALINIWVIGIQLLSDFGLAPSLQRSQNWNKSELHHTAWSLQILRGLVIFTLTYLIADEFEKFYNYPNLSLYLIVGTTSILISSFASVEIFIHPRRGLFKEIALFEFKAQLVGSLLGLIFCIIYPSIWALIVIPIISSIYKLIFSFKLTHSHKPIFRLDKSFCKEILPFGGLILICTALHFSASYFDRFLIGKFYDKELLGIYCIALALAESPRQWASQMSSKFILPLIAQKNHQPEFMLYKTILQKREKPVFILSICLSILICTGDLLFIHLYSIEYADASWIFQILLIGLWFTIMSTTSESLHYLKGKPWAPIIGNLIKCLHLALIPLLIILEFTWLEIIIWISVKDIWLWAVLHIGYKKRNISFIRQDIISFFIFIFTLFICTELRAYFGYPLAILNKIVTSS